MKIKRFALAIMVLFCFSIEIGCHTLSIESNLHDAKILIDGVTRDEATPHAYSVRDFSLGWHSVTVEKKGYKTITSPQEFKIGISAGDIVWSVLLPFPIFFINLIHNHWKDVTENIGPFVLTADSPEANLPAAK